jgi:hypothetical protein
MILVKKVHNEAMQYKNQIASCVSMNNINISDYYVKVCTTASDLLKSDNLYQVERIIV